MSNNPNQSAVQVLEEEMDLKLTLDRFDARSFGDLGPGRLIYHHYLDFSAGIASGSAGELDMRKLRREARERLKGATKAAGNAG